MSVKPAWAREGRDWPHRETSRFVEAGGLMWHVQVMGHGPPVLLLHGSGAASHSWRDIATGLAGRFTLIIPDLPGHGFTGAPGGDGLSLDGMARSLGALNQALGLRPWAAVGHSAGAAVAIRMRLDGRIGDGGVVAINGALRPFPGSAGWLFPALARLIFLNPPAMAMFAWRARAPGAIARLLEGTGSRIDARGLELYRRLLSTSGHVAGALGMMANWNLQPLVEALPRLPVPFTLIVAEGDRAVPPEVSREACAATPGARLVTVPGLGHLAHEEQPALVAALILDALRSSAESCQPGVSA
jgi:magnesium chelatase accessory protein